MVCTAEHLLGWKDFPKGLRVLLLDDEDSASTAEIKSRLEEMDYIVSTFCDVNNALMALSDKPESFHVAVVEVSTKNEDNCFKFLETAKDLPTIMTSNIQCISTMMKCIALGAAEFLQKPLSEDKLRNIWQHVVHKAFSSKEKGVSETPKPVKEETTLSKLQFKQEKKEVETQHSQEIEDSTPVHDCEHDQSTVSDKFPAPSTPQLKQGCRFSNDRVCQDKTNSTVEKVSGDQEGESKSVDTTSNDSVAKTTFDKSFAEDTVMVDPSVTPNEGVVREDSLEGSKSGSSLLSHPQKLSRVGSSSDAGHSRRSSLHPNSCGKKSNRKNKVDWTPELHKRFVQAVEKLGVDQAIPSRILDLMKVEGLTRHNVASHLQKYRMNKRHIRPKDEDRRWQHPRDPIQKIYPQKPIMAYPPYHPNHGFPTNQFYPVWGHPSHHPSSIHTWGHPSFPTWHPQESWSWNAPPGIHVDAFGRPLMPPSQGPYPSFPQYPSGHHNLNSFEDSSSTRKTSFDLHPAEEVIDKVVKEAISKPWLPLPLGLKPPSTESVLSELHRQGICSIPPPPHSSQM